MSSAWSTTPKLWRLSIASSTEKGRARLLPRVEDNGRRLVFAYRTLVESLRSGHSISPAAEWLVDNFHIIEEQLREIREDLPKSYYRELPKLADGELKISSDLCSRTRANCPH